MAANADEMEAQRSLLLSEIEPIRLGPLSPEALASPAIQRLLDEVRSESTTKDGHLYNRQHNRHNRGR